MVEEDGINKGKSNKKSVSKERDGNGEGNNRGMGGKMELRICKAIVYVNLYF